MQNSSAQIYENISPKIFCDFIEAMVALTAADFPIERAAVTDKHIITKNDTVLLKTFWMYGKVNF